MQPIEYKRADLNDIELLINFRIDFLVSHFGTQPQELEQPFRDEMRKYFEQAIPDNTYICYYAICNNAITGIGGMVIRQRPGNFVNPEGKEAYIMSMYTLPQFRRMGIASGIVKKLTDSATALGVKLLELHATEEGEPVYIKEGFKKHHEPTYRKYI